jgi:tripartite-type tricarboxylate transporter receptor subunit TctC
VVKVYELAVKITAMPDVREKLAQLGFDTSAEGPDAFRAIIKTDTEKWAKVIKDAGITAGN